VTANTADLEAFAAKIDAAAVARVLSRVAALRVIAAGFDATGSPLGAAGVREAAETLERGS
jgi:hypothetical protein